MSGHSDDSDADRQELELEIRDRDLRDESSDSELMEAAGFNHANVFSGKHRIFASDSSCFRHFIMSERLGNDPNENDATNYPEDVCDNGQVNDQS